MSEVREQGSRRQASSGRRNQLGQAMGAKGTQTRRRLLDATARQLKTTPLRDLRVVHIVRDAKTSPATFYVYFNDVSEAVLALIGELTQSPPNILGLFDARWEPESALERAQTFASAYVDHWEANAPLFRLRNLASDEGDERFGRVRVNAVAPLIGAMADRIAEGQRAGEVPRDLHPHSAAGALLALIERISAVRLDSGDKWITRARMMRVAALLSALLFASGDTVTRAFASGARAGDPIAETAAWIRECASEATETPESEQLNLNGQAIGAKGARTRLRIIEATEEMLAKKPLLELSVAEIAAAAQTSTSTFYLYFRDVSEAVLAAAERVSVSSPELLALVAAPWDVATCHQKAQAFVAGYIESWQQHRALFRVRNLASDEGDLRFERARRAATRPFLEAIAMRVAEKQVEGALPADIHPPSMAAAILAMVERLAVIPNVPTGRNATVHTVIHAAGRFVAALLTGAAAWSTPAVSGPDAAPGDGTYPQN